MKNSNPKVFLICSDKYYKEENKMIIKTDKLDKFGIGEPVFIITEDILRDTSENPVDYEALIRDAILVKGNEVLTEEYENMFVSRIGFKIENNELYVNLMRPFLASMEER